MKSKAIILLHIQGWYFLLTGIWPLLDIDSFQAVTGYKTDLWLVNTVGVLVIAIAISMLVAAFRKELTVPTIVLALSSMMALTIIDIVYVLNHTISIIYLTDAGFETILILLWIALGLS